MAAVYLSEVHNRTANLNLPNNITPHQMRFSVTPDILAYLQFTFWVPILLLDSEEIQPNTTERPERWLGVAHNISDALTYQVYDDQSKWIYARSVICHLSPEP